MTSHGIPRRPTSLHRIKPHRNKNASFGITSPDIALLCIAVILLLCFSCIAICIRFVLLLLFTLRNICLLHLARRCALLTRVAIALPLYSYKNSLIHLLDTNSFRHQIKSNPIPTRIELQVESIAAIIFFSKNQVHA